ncbi:MAG: hypothetical protein ACREAC_01155, partial [Blastocatellia bacterium]
MIFGLLPAWLYSQADAGQALKAASRIVGDRGGRMMRQALAISEITLVVLTSAVLMMESYRKLEHIDLGFQLASVLTLQISLPDKKYPAARDIGAFFQKAVERVTPCPALTAQRSFRNCRCWTARLIWRTAISLYPDAQSKMGRPGERAAAGSAVLAPSVRRNTGEPVLWCGLHYA